LKHYPIGFGRGFKTTINTASYTYDLNGNMSRDNHKKVNLSYFHHNMLKKAAFDNGNTIDFVYDAMGNKLSKKTSAASNNMTHYVGGIEYLGTPAAFNLEAVYHAEGRASLQGSTWRYEYALRDHLGSTRVTFADLDNNGEASNAEILQQNHYYGFGANIEGLSTAGAANKYQYNGKEWNADLGLEMNDYGARFYDPWVSRWWGVDPAAVKYSEWSPYNYVLGNPARNIDPRGDTVRIIGLDGNPLNWMPGMGYSGEDAFVGQAVEALNLLYQNRNLGEIFLANGRITGNIFDFAEDANRHVSIRNMWNADGTAFNPMAAAISIDYTNETGTEILFDAFTGVHVGDISPTDAADPEKSYHNPGNLSPATLLGHELGYAWLTQFAPNLKSKLSAASLDPEHSRIIHGRNGIETRIGLALDGAARVFRTPYNTINPPQLVPGSAPLKYYDHIITTSGSTSNVAILNKYNH
jgi:RHS repeat-associated protein